MSASEAPPLTQRAAEALDAGRVEEAAALWRRRLRAAPSDVVAWMALADALRAGESPEEAGALYAELISAGREQSAPLVSLLAGLAARREGLQGLLEHALGQPVASGVEIAHPEVLAEDGPLPSVQLRGPYGLPLLGLLDAEALDAITPALSRRRVEAGAALIREGDPAEAAYLLVGGRLSVIKESARRGEVRLATLKPGALVGEIGLILSSPRTATVKAERTCELIRVDLESLRASAAESPALQFALEGFARARTLDQLLMTSPCFDGLKPAARAALIGAFEVHEVEAGARLLAQGDPGRWLFLIEAGAVEVHRAEGEGIHLLATLGPGEVFGEMALLSEDPAVATVTAVAPTRLLRLSTKAWTAIIEADPALRARLAALGAARAAEIRFIFEDDTFIEPAD